MYEKKYRECEKQLRRCKKSDEKLKRDTSTSNRTSRHEDSTQFSTRSKQFSESDYDVEAKNRMQDQLACDSQTFVLNQLMLAVQFYGHFEKYVKLFSAASGFLI